MSGQTSLTIDIIRHLRPKVNPISWSTLILFRLRSPLFVPLFQGSQIVLLGETSAGAGVLFLAAITRILHNHKPPIQSAFQASCAYCDRLISSLFWSWYGVFIVLAPLFSHSTSDPVWCLATQSCGFWIVPS